MVDPALKGTRFGAALEAAERDEQKKREQRAHETKGLSDRARIIAEAMRGNLPFPDLNIQIDDTGDDPMTTTAQPYTESQLNILAMGMEAKNARIPRGNFTKRLFDEGLIIRTEIGCYKTTDAGRELWKAEAAAPKAVPAPETPRTTESQDGLEVAALRLQLQQTTSLANDRGERIEGLLNRIEELKRQNEQSGGQTLFSDDVDAWLKDYMTSVADIEKIREKQTKDQAAHLSILAYVMEIRRQIDELDKDLQQLKHINPDIYAQAQAQIAQIGDMMTEDETLLSVIDYVADLRRKAATVDQAATQVEALRREINEHKIAADEWQKRFKAADKNYLAALILAELCDLLPEIEAYRTARENAVAAIDKLKARRS